MKNKKSVLMLIIIFHVIMIITSIYINSVAIFIGLDIVSILASIGYLLSWVFIFIYAYKNISKGLYWYYIVSWTLTGITLIIASIINYLPDIKILNILLDYVFTFLYFILAVPIVGIGGYSPVFYIVIMLIAISGGYLLRKVIKEDDSNYIMD